MSRRPLTVLKLGGSVLRDEAALASAVHEIYRFAREGQVIAVVSALSGTTDGLLAQAKRFGERPDDAALAALVATGEQTASALLALALDCAGLTASVFDAARLGLRTRGPLLDAEPEQLETAALRGALDSGAVAVVPGFLGLSADGRTSLLGRGGSDYTALFLAAELAASRCRLVKDVAGLYERDPALGGHAAGYASLHWDDALQIAGRAVQPRALRFARERQQAFEVAALHAAEATLVGPGPTLRAGCACAARPLRVGLLGLGTVGRGVFERLRDLPALFEVVNIAVLNPARHAGTVSARLLSTHGASVVDAADVVVEALPGEEPAGQFVQRALAQGKAVVSANKALLAARGDELQALAARRGGTLRASAAVGGALPVLETARALAGPGLERIETVLNGTSGCVLDRIAAGATLDQAVQVAQKLGFAEADPTRDLDGRDVEAKLRLLSRATFEREPELSCSGITELAYSEVRAAAQRGEPIRLVGRLERRPDGRIIGAVRAESIPSGHALFGLREERNGVAFHTAGCAPVVLRGRGAGRWPTAESVLADLLDLARKQCGAAELSEERPA